MGAARALSLSLALAVLVAAQSTSSSFRLPGNVRPRNYTLRIVTHFQDDDFRFYGQMSVDVEAVRNTSEIRLHAKQLKVDRDSVTVTPVEQQRPPVEVGFVDEEAEGNDIPELTTLAAPQPTPPATTQGSTTQGSATQGSTTQGSTTQGSTTQGSTTQGSTTQGSTTQGSTTTTTTTQESATAQESLTQPPNEKVDQSTPSVEARRAARARMAPEPPGHYEHKAGDASFRGLTVTNVTMDVGLQQVIVELGEPLRAGEHYRIAMRYWGTLNTEDRGYYRGSYRLDNQTRWLSATVFEPAEARRAFPCFDEPHLKAHFELYLGRHANYSSSSNMPSAHTRPMEGVSDWFWDYYPPSPRMPTYLVAFMVHSLQDVVWLSGAGEVRARGVPGRVQQSNFSMHVASRVLTILEGKLGVMDAMPKHDLVAVPGFRSEALENWGLASFEERHLLLPSTAGQLSKQSVGTVVAHEMAHSWFGNMITPAWWSDIWLSEGFATYYSAEAMERLFPSWRFHETATGNAFLLISSTDASPNSLPLIHPADNPNKLESIFSAISYYKGYWMLRMLRAVLGAEAFDGGVRRYVRRHRFASARTRDLWAALQDSLDEREELDLEDAAAGIEPDVYLGDSDEDEVVVVGDSDEDDEDDEELVRVVPPSTSPPLDSASSIVTVTTPTATSEPSTASSSTTSSTKAPTASSPTTPGPSPSTSERAAATPTDSAGRGTFWRRSRRAATAIVQVPASPVAQLAAGIAGSAERDDDDDNDDEVERLVEAAGNVTDSPAPSAGDKATSQQAEEEEELEEEKKGPLDAVESPPRRGPGAMAYSAQPNWLPKPISHLMRNWVQQPGYPVINVYRNLETGVVTLNQRRFLASAGGQGGSGACNASSTWWVPVRYATSATSAAETNPADEPVFWMPPSCANVTLPARVGRDDWVLLNAGLIGLYRVRYDQRTLQQLSRLPRTAWLQVGPLSRLQLVSDSLEMARLGRSAYQPALRMVDHLAKDPSPLVWRAALPHLLLLHRQLRSRRDALALRTWLQELVSPQAAVISFATRAQDSPQQASLRYKVTTLACLADHAVCQRKAKKALRQLMAGQHDAIVPGRLTHTQLCAAVRWGGPAEWRFLRGLLADATPTPGHAPGNALPRKIVIGALGCSRNQETLRSFLAETVAANMTLRRADVAAVLAAVAANEAGSDVTLRFMEEQAETLYRRLGSDAARIEKVVREVSSSLNSKRQLDRLDAVLRQFQAQTTSRSPPTWGRDTVRDNMQWAERSRAEISRWLRIRVEDEIELRVPSSSASKPSSSASKSSSSPAKPSQASVKPAAPAAETSTTSLPTASGSSASSASSASTRRHAPSRPKSKTSSSKSGASNRASRTRTAGHRDSEMTSSKGHGTSNDLLLNTLHLNSRF